MTRSKDFSWHFASPAEPVDGLLDLEALVAEHGRDGIDDRRLVVDDEHTLCPRGLRTHPHFDSARPQPCTSATVIAGEERWLHAATGHGDLNAARPGSDAPGGRSGRTAAGPGPPEGAAQLPVEALPEELEPMWVQVPDIVVDVLLVEEEGLVVGLVLDELVEVGSVSFTEVAAVGLARFVVFGNGMVHRCRNLVGRRRGSGRAHAEADSGADRSGAHRDGDECVAPCV